MAREQIVIVGAGFGGLRAAKALSGHAYDVLLIDRHNYHCFQPLLYQVATAGLEPEQIAYPVRGIIRRWPHVRFLMANVEHIDHAAQLLTTSTGAVKYDHLIIAAGGRTNFFNLPGVREHSFGLKTLEDAERLRNHILLTFEQAAYETDSQQLEALRTFVIVGGGPTGVEMAGALRELVRHVLTRDFPGLREHDVRIILLEAGNTILSMLPPKLQRHALARLRTMGVDVQLQTTVVRADSQHIELKDGRSIPTATLIWAAGIQGVEFGGPLKDSLARGGRVRVNPDLSLVDDPRVWIIGDLAYLEANEVALPQVAPVAMQQGEQVARNIIARRNGQPTTPFRYRDKGSMATIGRNAAVAHINGLSFSGFPAWIVWLAVHLVSLIGFRNRLVVLINWAYNYISYDRAIRIITATAPTQQALKETDPNQEHTASQG